MSKVSFLILLLQVPLRFSLSLLLIIMVLSFCRLILFRIIVNEVAVLSLFVFQMLHFLFVHLKFDSMSRLQILHGCILVLDRGLSLRDLVLGV